LEGFEHKFRLILTYPKDREFYNKLELKQKIAEFYSLVLQDLQYAIRFRVDIVDAGVVGNSYLLRFQGTLDGEYLEVTPDEVVKLLIVQLEAFFTVVKEGEFKSIYLEIDSKIIYQPDNEFIPVDQKDNTWERTSQPDFWDDIWDIYIISELIDLLPAAIEMVVGTDIDFNPFDGDGLPLPDIDLGEAGEAASGFFEVIIDFITGIFD
jgi:hypothetical protein